MHVRVLRAEVSPLEPVNWAQITLLTICKTLVVKWLVLEIFVGYSGFEPTTSPSVTDGQTDGQTR